MILAERIVLFLKSCKLTRGDCDLVSIIIKSIKEMTPTNTIVGIKYDPIALAWCE